MGIFWEEGRRHDICGEVGEACEISNRKCYGNVEGDNGALLRTPQSAIDFRNNGVKEM